MTILFMITLAICGLFDLKDRAVPLWSICLVGLTGIAVSIHHPVFSLLSGIIMLIICLANKMGKADQILFPIVAAALGMFGILITGTALAIAVWHGRKSPAPAVSYLCLISIPVLLIGGLL
jgi:hypothetical protein